MRNFALIALSLIAFSSISFGELPGQSVTNVVASSVKGVPSSELVDGVAVVKDLANILFFLIASTIAVLTYLQARKTIFTPFRTETYKLQLKAFEDVLMFFQKHPSIHIDGEFDYERIVHINSVHLFDDFSYLFFPESINKDKLKQRRDEEFKDVVGAVVTRSYMEKNFELPTDTRRAATRSVRPTAPALILAEWQSYECGITHYTAKHHEALDAIERFGVSPLLPKALKELIEKFQDTARKNVTLVGEVMTEVSQALPQKYPTIDSLAEADLTWVWNAYNKKRVSLEENQSAILQYLEKYLQVDTFLAQKTN